jgi:hypothetical protein
MTQLRCKRAREANPLVFATLNPATLAQLEAARQSYSEMAGAKRVSRSVVIRRALQLLSDHLGGVRTPAELQAEMAQLLLVR